MSNRQSEVDTAPHGCFQQEINTPRQAALEALFRILETGEKPKTILNDLPQLDTRDRALVMELTYGVLRHLLSLDNVLNQFLKNPQKKLNPWVRNNLRLGIYQLLHTDRLPDRAVVHEAVNLAKSYGPPQTSGFVNAILRNVIRNRQKIQNKPVKQTTAVDIAAATSHPVWLIERWIRQYGLEEAAALALSNNQIPPLCLRVNTLKTDRLKAGALLKQHGILFRNTRYSPDGIEVLSHRAFEVFPDELKPVFQPQDEASQLIACLVSPSSGERVLDACAAPGGKTTHMAQLMNNQGQIVALDWSEKRMQSLIANAQRLGIHIIKPLIANLEHRPLLGQFDKILLDAPCTGIGVIRRNPDIKWKRQETDFAEFSQKQLILLDSVTEYLKPGGILVYSVCSTDNEEGEEVIHSFLKKHSNMVKTPLPVKFDFVNAMMLKTFPHQHNTDGFFAVRLRKTR
jgi:16S rRNA (cytosine967-C5)-methyltransferase